MKAHAPPENGRTPVWRPRLKSQASTHSTFTSMAVGPQACEHPNQILRGWYAEAQRIAREYHRSGRIRHLRAFLRHMIGVMQEVEKALPR
jgi:hypothetical protein